MVVILPTTLRDQANSSRLVGDPTCHREHILQWSTQWTEDKIYFLLLAYLSVRETARKVTSHFMCQSKQLGQLPLLLITIQPSFLVR